MQDVNDELKDVVHKNTAILEKVSDQLKITYETNFKQIKGTNA